MDTVAVERQRPSGGESLSDGAVAHAFSELGRWVRQTHYSFSPDEGTWLMRSGMAVMRAQGMAGGFAFGAVMLVTHAKLPYFGGPPRRISMGPRLFVAAGTAYMAAGAAKMYATKASLRSLLALTDSPLANHVRETLGVSNPVPADSWRASELASEFADMRAAHLDGVAHRDSSADARTAGSTPVAGSAESLGGVSGSALDPDAPRGDGLGGAGPTTAAPTAATVGSSSSNMAHSVADAAPARPSTAARRGAGSTPPRVSSWERVRARRREARHETLDGTDGFGTELSGSAAAPDGALPTASGAQRHGARGRGAQGGSDGSIEAGDTRMISRKNRWGDRVFIETQM
eukprot:CAMPEP_0119418552 /NCGR_PEP_ID=MMETSP1335-20130426/18520_1 /TAXON_ID=259385 /ORGANISM="Chrysoculter rhomboideus, Strain RCC1486" /LENGTH=345 /DNA_ID=CAMNT_0007443805 /DNA_START=3 /DNA_END=1040 /DNA_ORIENTATION=+